MRVLKASYKADQNVHQNANRRFDCPGCQTNATQMEKYCNEEYLVKHFFAFPLN